MSFIKNLIFKTGARVIGSEIYRKLNFSHDQSRDPAFEVQRELIKNSQPVIFDVGARYGQISETYKKWFPDSQVFAFEPFPESYRELEKVYLRLKGIQTFNLAISDKEGEVTLYANKFSAANSTLESDDTNTIIDTLTENQSVLEVAAIDLDTFTVKEGIDKIDILKMDIQGGELKALRGAARLLTEKKIDLIYTEVLFMGVYKGQPYFHDIASLMKEHGYELYNIYNPWYAKKRLSWADALFINPAIIS